MCKRHQARKHAESGHRRTHNSGLGAYLHLESLNMTQWIRQQRPTTWRNPVKVLGRECRLSLPHGAEVIVDLKLFPDYGDRITAKRSLTRRNNLKCLPVYLDLKSHPRTRKDPFPARAPNADPRGIFQCFPFSQTRPSRTSCCARTPATAPSPCRPPSRP
jgi:hypothetical protein